MSVTLSVIIIIIIIIIIIRFVKRQNVKRLPWRGGLHTAWLQGVVTGIGLQRPVYSRTAELAVVQPAECE